jgi:hypothetical protein
MIDTTTDQKTSVCPHCQEPVKPKATRCPHCQGKIKRGIGAGGVLLILILVWVIGSIVMNSATSTTTPSATNGTTAPAPLSSFNIPSLIGKNIDEVEAVIGGAVNTWEPTAEQVSLSTPVVPLATKNFRKGKTELSIDYDAKTRKVSTLFIATDDPSGATVDKQRLLFMGLVHEGAMTYTIEFVPSLKDPSSFTGVIVTPQ